METIKSLSKIVVLFLIRIYQYLLSPLLGKQCRFYPSCSEYTKESVYQFGVIKGVGLGLKRLLRCHPWHEGGYDPVPKDDNII